MFFRSTALSLVIGLTICGESVADESMVNRGCVKPMAISVPSGKVASRDEMQEARVALQGYLADARDYRSCMEKEMVSSLEDSKAIAKKYREEAVLFNEANN